MNRSAETRENVPSVVAPVVPIDSTVLQRLYAWIAGTPLVRAAVITLWYIIVVSISYYGAFLLRFDGDIPFSVHETIIETLPVLLLIRILVFQRFGLYSGFLRYVSVEDIWSTMKALWVSTLIFMVIVYVVQPGFTGFPRSVFVVETMLTLGILSVYRMVLRSLRERSKSTSNEGSRQRKILIVGDLDSSDSLLRVLRPKNGTGSVVAGIVHEDPHAKGKKLRNIKVLGSPRDLPEIVRTVKPSEVLILPPYASSPRSLREVINRCILDAEYSCTFRMVPSLLDIADGKTTVSLIRNVEIEDLLGRPPVTIDRSEVRAFLTGRAVMVTGAGGSIGSELCLQIARYSPKRIVLYELSEYGLYRIEYDLRRAHPTLEIVPIAGDVCDERRLRKAVERYEIEIIYHAAAYKHVPLMESNVPACVKSNVIGTERVARVAEDTSVRKMVLISSDKAVRPTSVMGASKRLAERLIQERPLSDTQFIAVRFGNVLDSSGSVIPLFKKQIKAGGPVTVTHPEVTRYFMSIPEAVDLVLQAAIVGNDREIMVLEMGEPVNILALATNLIELSGLKPGKDIEIVFTGLRPGEKLYEELMADGDAMVRTEYEKIWVLENNHVGLKRVPIDLAMLEEAVREDDEARLRHLLSVYVQDAPRAEESPHVPETCSAWVE